MSTQSGASSLNLKNLLDLRPPVLGRAGHDPQVLRHLNLAAAVGMTVEAGTDGRGWQGRTDTAIFIFGACIWQPNPCVERCSMECKQPKNLKQCTCSYGSCSRKGLCCECVSYHLGAGELPGCFFPPDGGATYDRSFVHFARLVANGKVG